jgi:hypothetical protein
MLVITSQEERAITDWLHEVISKHTWPDHDLHIDRINRQLKEQRHQWVSKSLDYLQVAYQLVNESSYRVVLAIGLEMTDYKRDTENLSLAVEPIELSHTPPSLYLYDQDDERCKRFDENMTNKTQIDGVAFRFYLFQWEDEDEAGKYHAAFHIEIA